MNDREVIDEKYEEKCELVYVGKHGRSGYVNKYHIVRGSGLLAMIITNEIVARQVVAAMNQQPIYYYEQNLPTIIRDVLPPLKEKNDARKL